METADGPVRDRCGPYAASMRPLLAISYSIDEVEVYEIFWLETLGEYSSRRQVYLPGPARAVEPHVVNE